MKTILLPRSSIAILGTLLFTGLAALAADKPQVAGTWKWSQQTRDGQTRESALVLKLEGEKLTGALKGARAETPIQEAKLEGNEVSFKIERETQRGKMTALYKGKVEGDTIRGTIATRTGEQSREREWLAKRDGAPAIDIAGDWAWIMKRDNGETWEATLRLKRDGNAITGHFIRPDGEANIELRNAKLVAATLTFDTVLERDGNSMTIHNTATVAGRKMTGKSQGDRNGESWTRDWEATRKD